MNADEFAEYLNSKTGNFGAYVEDRGYTNEYRDDGKDSVAVYVGSTGSTAKPIQAAHATGWEIAETGTDVDGSDVVVFIPPEVADWYFEPYDRTFERKHADD